MPSMSAAPGLAVASPRWETPEWCLSPVARLHTGANRRRGPPTGVRHGHRDGQVHVSDHRVHNHSPSKRHPSSRALTRKSTPSQQPCSQTWFPHKDPVDGHIGRHAKTTKKEHAKEGPINSRQEIDRSNGQCNTSERTTLGAHQRKTQVLHAQQVEGKKLLIECAKKPMILSATTRCLSLTIERLSMLSRLTFRSLHNCPQPHVMAFCEILNQLWSDHEHVICTN